MFHRYVLPAVGTKPVDFDRARLLMDRELLRRAIKEMNAAKSTDLQWIWDRYCSLHFERYGQSFEPNSNPEWGG